MNSMTTQPEASPSAENAASAPLALVTRTSQSGGIAEPTAAAAPHDTQGSLPQTELRTEPSMRRLVAVGALAVVAALAGGFAASDPTGIAWIDGFYRAAGCFVIVVAASRAPGWALAWAGATLAVFSAGLTLVAVAVAIGLVVVDELVDRGREVANATAGLLLSLALLRLGHVGFHGLTAVVGMIAMVPLLVTGYRNHGRRTRRFARWGVIGLAGAAAAGATAALVAGAVHSGDMDAAIRQSSDGLDALKGGQDTTADEELAEAEAKFASTTATFTSPLLSLSRAVPVVSQHVATVGDLAGAGVDLTAAAQSASGVVDYDSLSLPDGGIDLDTLDEFREPIVRSNQAVTRALSALGDHRSPWLAAPLVARMDELEADLLDVAPDAETARLALESLPALLGGETERHYLILFGSPAEARDIGGHIGHYAELVAEDGSISLTKTGPIRDLWTAEGAEDRRLVDPSTYPASFLEARPERFPQNWGATPDLPTVARAAAELYPQSGGRPVDGVGYIDPEGIAAMLEITGPITVSGLADARTADNAVQYLVADQYMLFEDGVHPTVLSHLLEEVFETFTSIALPGPENLGRILGPAVRGGHLQFWSFDESEAPLLDRAGLSGRLPAIDAGQDFVSVLTRNANPNKIDRYLERQISHDVQWHPDAERLDATTTVELFNGAPPNADPPVVFGNAFALPPGTNRTALSILSPLTATELRVDGESTPFSKQREFDRWRYSVLAEIPPGEKVTVELVTSTSRPVGDAYELVLASQPLVNPDEVTVSLTTIGTSSESTHEADLESDDARTIFEGSLVQDTLVTARVGGVD